MPAKSKAQQKLFGMALAYKRGELDEDEVSQKVIGLANQMSEKELEDFAETERKDLPKKVKEILGNNTFQELLDENNTYATPGSTPGMGPIQTPGNPGPMSQFGSQASGSGDPYQSAKRTNKFKNVRQFLSFIEYRSRNHLQ